MINYFTNYLKIPYTNNSQIKEIGQCNSIYDKQKASGPDVGVENEGKRCNLYVLIHKH
jgi:hypothetical protein